MFGNFENKRNGAGAQCKLQSPKLLTDVTLGKSAGIYAAIWPGGHPGMIFFSGFATFLAPSAVEIFSRKVRK